MFVCSSNLCSTKLTLYLDTVLHFYSVIMLIFTRKETLVYLTTCYAERKMNSVERTNVLCDTTN